LDFVENDNVPPGIDIAVSVKPQFIDDALRLKVFSNICAIRSSSSKLK